MATFLEQSEKLVRIDSIQINALHLVKNVKIGRVDPEIYCLI